MPQRLPPALPWTNSVWVKPRHLLTSARRTGICASDSGHTDGNWATGVTPGPGFRESQRLIEEVAYEHWHRMLFARFLAENNLLMYPDPDGSVAVTLEECEDLAADEGAANGWELACPFRHPHAAADLPARFACLPTGPAAGVPAKTGAPGGRPATGGIHRLRQPRLGLPILAGQEEGRGQRFRGQDRRS